jgi:hypothetical protein
MPLKDGVVRSAVWRGRLGIAEPKGYRQPDAFGFRLRGCEHSCREIDSDSRVP